jgi:hypothetical protein
MIKREGSGVCGNRETLELLKASRIDSKKL